MDTTLAKPDNVAASHSLRLQQAIVAVMATTDGGLSFTDFMHMALYAPGLGYYCAGANKFGAEGDFVTAPEISPLFSQCLAKQCVQVLSTTGSDILEFGAGRGIMAADILLTLEDHDCLPDHYYILEVSPDLRARQYDTLQQKCSHLLERVQWLSELPVAGIRGVILANEVLDAMPVTRFQTQGPEIKEYFVEHSDHGFDWQLHELSDKVLANKIQTLQQEFFADVEAYSSELNPLLPGWMASVADCLREGVVLLFDYGYPQHEYYHADRSMGTLMCHYQHQAHSDPLINIGLQDITAHVDFTAVAEAAVESNLDVLGYTSQAFFLLGNGLTDLINTENEREQLKQTQAIKILTLPSEMGELIKVVALGKQFDEPLTGFAMQDRRGRL